MSLTLTEARERAADLSQLSYAVHLDLREPGRGRFGSRTTVRLTTASGSTFLELAGATDLVVTVDGAATEPAYDGVRLHLDLAPGAHEVVVDARLPLVTDGDGMHVVTDPADGATYVSAYLGMDVAQKVFCCADQNDLKAPLTLTVDADPAATVLANGRATRDGRAAGDGRWAFATTPPLPPAMVVVCAGPWHSRTWTHAGLPFGWHARASLAADLDRDFDELRATTEACFDHYATLFDEPYAFDSYDQAFVPGQNWGALETPGCVTYRDELLPRGHTTEVARGSRTTTIAHEMAHMWFGDLVTMTWWEDTWLQESFADHLGYRVAQEACGRADAPLRREVQRTVTGYDADRRRSTHPVAPRAEEVPDVDAAAGNFDMISYAKGGACLQQLTVWLGDAAFLRGVNLYLARHRFGNATLDDFVAALDDASDRDVRAWVAAWLRTSGHDTLRVADGSLVRDGTRPHRVGVAALDPSSGREVGRVTVDVPAPLPGWAGLAVVPNAGAETFARVELDDATWATVAAHLAGVEDPLLRAVLWTGAFTGVEVRTRSAAEHLALVATQLPAEPHWLLVDAVLARTVGRVLPLRVAAADVAGAERALAAACREGLAGAGDDTELVAAWAGGLVATTDDAAELLGWLDGGAPLALTPTLRWAVVRRACELGGAGADLVERERGRDGSVQGELGAARALAARPTGEAKEQAWAAAAAPGVGNRELEATLGGLFSPRQAGLVAPFVARYLAEAPGWAARGQAFARTVGRAFPAVPLDAAQVDALRAALAGGVPPVLARQWEDRLDDLVG